jgi:outer membrane autotransporter protein
VVGDAGAWTGSTANWTDAQGATSGAYNPDSLLVFAGKAGAVTVEGEQPVNGGLQFFVDGYAVRGGGLVLGGDTPIRVGDGTSAGAGFTATIASDLSGAGGITLDDLGTLRLAGDNRYAGGTRITHGTLIGSATSFGAGDIDNQGATLVIEQVGDATFGNALSGSGRFDKTGAGRLDLTGHSSFSGATTVREGALAVNGSLAQSVVSVADGARLGGNGTVGGLVVQRGATAAPGNSIGALKVAGDVRFEAGSVYEVEVNDAAQGDHIAATGTATIVGGTVSVRAAQGDYASATPYIILSAEGGVSGAFTDVTSNLAFLEPTLGYHATEVELMLTRNDVAFADVGASRNQRAAGAAVEALAAGNPIRMAVADRLDANGARAAFDQLSGEIHASTQAALMEDSRFVREAALARPTQGRDTQAWARAIGAWGQTAGSGGAAALDRTVHGVMLGADLAAAGDARIGVLAGYTRGEHEAEGRASRVESENRHLALYAGAQRGAVSLRAGAAYTWHDISSHRDLSFPGYADTVESAGKARSAQWFGELGVAIPTQTLALEPFANVAVVNLKTDAVSERGGGAALDAGAATLNTRFATLGLRIGSRGLDLAGLPARVNATVGWRHAFGGITPTTPVAFAGGTPFTVNGVPVARDAAVIGAGLEWSLGKAATLGLSYDGQFGSGVSDNGVRASLQARF